MFDVDKFNAVYCEAVKEFGPQQEKKKEEFAKAGLFDAAGAIDDIADTFCGAWPKVKPVLNTLLKYGSLFLPASVVTMAKAVIRALDQVLFPALCTPPAPVVRDNITNG